MDVNVTRMNGKSALGDGLSRHIMTVRNAVDMKEAKQRFFNLGVFTAPGNGLEYRFTESDKDWSL